MADETGPETNVSKTDWWWVRLSKTLQMPGTEDWSPHRVAGFEYRDMAKAWGDDNYPGRYRLEQGTPDHLPTAHDRREEAYYAQRRAEFDALSPEEQQRERERNKRYWESIQPLPVGGQIHYLDVVTERAKKKRSTPTVEEVEESLGDQALMAVEDELTITLEPPPKPERECPGTMGGTHNVVSLVSTPYDFFCKGCGLKIVCTCSYDESEEMTRHAPLCALVKAGVTLP